RPGSRERATDPHPVAARYTKITWSSRSIDSKLSTSGGYPCCSRSVAAESAASRQCARPVRTTPRKLRSVSPPISVLYGRWFSQCCTAAGVRSRAITRRSAAVRSSAGGTAGSVRGSGSRGEVGNEFVGQPAVARVDGLEAAVGVDDGGAQVVSDLHLVGRIAFDQDAELLHESRRLDRFGGEERPAFRIRA